MKEPSHRQFELIGIVDEINLNNDGVCWTEHVAERLRIPTHTAYGRLSRLEKRGLLKKTTVQGVEQTGMIRCYWDTLGDLING